MSQMPRDERLRPASEGGRYPLGGLLDVAAETGLLTHGGWGRIDGRRGQCALVPLAPLRVQLCNRRGAPHERSRFQDR